MSESEVSDAVDLRTGVDALAASSDGGQDQPLATIRINTNTYRVPAGPMIVVDLRHVPFPPVDDDHDMWLARAPDVGDLLLRDDELVDIRDGLQVFTAPRRILAGARH